MRGVVEDEGGVVLPGGRGVGESRWGRRGVGDMRWRLRRELVALGVGGSGGVWSWWSFPSRKGYWWWRLVGEWVVEW